MFKNKDLYSQNKELKKMKINIPPNLNNEELKSFNEIVKPQLEELYSYNYGQFEFNNVKIEIIKKIKEDNLKIWLNIFLERDLWEICMDSKYEIIEAIGMAYPLYDKGILGALRVAQIHKSLVLKKFEKYVYS